MIRQSLHLAGLLNPPVAKGLFSSPYRAGKSPGLHDALETLSANDLNDAKQPANASDFWRRIDKQTSFKKLAHEAALSTHGDSATRHFGERSFAATLTQINARLAPVSAQVTAARCPTVAAVTSPLALE